MYISCFMSRHYYRLSYYAIHIKRSALARFEKKLFKQPNKEDALAGIQHSQPSTEINKGTFLIETGRKTHIFRVEFSLHYNLVSCCVKKQKTCLSIRLFLYLNLLSPLACLTRTTKHPLYGDLNDGTIYVYSGKYMSIDAISTQADSAAQISLLDTVYKYAIRFIRPVLSCV